MSDLAGRHLLIVGGGREALPGLARLRALGARLAVSDRDPQAPGLALADPPLLVSTYDAEATVAAARALHARRPLDGVLCIGSDVPLTVALVADALGLPGLPVAAARRVADKLAMKEALGEAGVPVPEFAPVGSVQELRSALRWIGLPAIAKPSDGRGARGVVRLRPGDDPTVAFAIAREASPSGRVVVERFVAGPQLSSESFVSGGAIATPGLADRNYEWLDACAPHVIENGGLQPARNAAALARAVDALVVAAADALGIPSGIVKGDLVVDAATGTIRVIEVAARLSGGSFCTLTIPHSTGVDLVVAAARHAVGIAVSTDALRPEQARPVANRYFRPPPGRLRAVRGFDEAARMPGVVFADLAVSPGEVIRPLVDHACRVGSVIATADDPDQAIARAEAAVATVHFDVDPADAPAGLEDHHEALPRYGLAG